MKPHTVALLTGASRGLGAALARALAQPDTHLFTFARHADPTLDAYAQAQGATLTQYGVDLSDPAATQAIARRFSAALPPTAGRYLLINNAATVNPILAADALTEHDAVSQALQLNVAAVMVLTAHFLAAVAQRPVDRRVLNISSGAGRNPTAGWAVYCASKAALDMYTRVVKQEQGPEGVRIVSIAPGIVDTAMQAHLRACDPAHFPGLAKFQHFHASGQLSAPASVAARLLAYLDRDDFGRTEIDDIRHYD